jgi:oxygen-independent coproporphyrinogen-3 oxidase
MTNVTAADLLEPEVGSYFVANYPPFSVWSRDRVDADVRLALDAPAASADTPLGLYLHIPFCRKRCHFCYFRVYTDKNARQVEEYLDLVAREWSMLARRRALDGRPLGFVYFGGGTPSFLSTSQLQSLVSRLTDVASWEAAEEVTFECEPGTISEAKLEVIRDIGVTRLSLGVESFDDEILEINGRAHRAPEIDRSYDYARRLGFPQINIDLIAGMLGETDDKWHASVTRTIDLAPDSVTIYQMELPFNTTISADLLKGTGQFAHQVADWQTRRRWVEEAFARLEQAGYTIGSAYTAVRHPSATKFIYRDRLWEGADLAALGVASFGHVNGVHLQNLDTWETYGAAIAAGHLPIGRSYRPSADERLIREVILQLKKGVLRPEYYQRKFGVDILERFSAVWASIEQDGYLAACTRDRVALTRAGLLRVDMLLHRFFLPEHRGVRYT